MSNRKMTAAERNRLLRKFHTLAAKVGMDKDAKIDFLEESYGVSSSAELAAWQLEEVCELLQNTINDKGDVWRKRVMAAIGGYLNRNGFENNAQMIKAVACRVTGYQSFNKIPVSRLRDIYNEFLKKQKVGAKVDEIDSDISAYTKLTEQFVRSKQYKNVN